MSLPASFAGCPQSELHHHCRAIFFELKKTLKLSQNADELKIAFERYLNIVRHIDFHQQPSAVYQKDENEKVASKLVKEFHRYIEALEANREHANPQDLLLAVTTMEHLIESIFPFSERIMKS